MSTSVGVCIGVLAIAIMDHFHMLPFQRLSP